MLASHVTNKNMNVCAYIQLILLHGQHVMQMYTFQQEQTMYLASHVPNKNMGVCADLQLILLHGQLHAFAAASQSSLDQHREPHLRSFLQQPNTAQVGPVEWSK